MHTRPLSEDAMQASGGATPNPSTTTIHVPVCVGFKAEQELNYMELLRALLTHLQQNPNVKAAVAVYPEPKNVMERARWEKQYKALLDKLREHPHCVIDIRDRYASIPGFESLHRKLFSLLGNPAFESNPIFQGFNDEEQHFVRDVRRALEQDISKNVERFERNEGEEIPTRDSVMNHLLEVAIDFFTWDGPILHPECYMPDFIGLLTPKSKTYKKTLPRDKTNTVEAAEKLAKVVRNSLGFTVDPSKRYSKVSLLVAAELPASTMRSEELLILYSSVMHDPDILPAVRGFFLAFAKEARSIKSMGEFAMAMAYAAETARVLEAKDQTKQGNSHVHIFAELSEERVLDSVAEEDVFTVVADADPGQLTETSKIDGGRRSASDMVRALLLSPNQFLPPKQPLRQRCHSAEGHYHGVATLFGVMPDTVNAGITATVTTAAPPSPTRKTTLVG